MKHVIELLITPEGKTSVQTLGFSGPSCREASKFLEQALGQRVQETLTAEFHASVAVSQCDQIRSNLSS